MYAGVYVGQQAYTNVYDGYTKIYQVNKCYCGL